MSKQSTATDAVRQTRSRVGRPAAFLVLSLCAVLPVGAADWTTRLGISGGLASTDNVNLAPSGQEQSDVLLSISPNAQARGVSGRSSTNVVVGGTQLISLTGSTDNQYVPRLQASSSHELVKQRVFLDFSAGIRRTFSVRTDRVSTTGASNGGRNTGTLTLSPRWQEHLGTYADFSAQYNYSQYFSDATTVTNSQRHSVNLQARSGKGTPRLAWNAFYRDTRSSGDNNNEAGSASLNLAYNLSDDWQFIATYGLFNGNSNQGGITGANNGNRLRAGVAWTPGNRTLFGLAMGPSNWAATATWGYSDKFQILGHYGRNGRDNFSDLNGGRPFWDTRVAWRPSPRSRVDVGYFRPEFGLNSEQANWEGLLTFDWPRTQLRLRGTQSTTTSQLQLVQSGFVTDPVTGQPAVDANGNLLVQGTPLVTETNEVFISRCLELNASRESRKNRFSLNMGIERRTFSNVADDERGYGGSFLWQYRYAPSTLFNYQVAYLNTRFDNDTTEDRQWVARLAVNKRLGRRLSVNVQYAFNQRFSTDPTREFTENSILLSLSYGLGSGETGFAGGGLGTGAGFASATGISGGNARVGNFTCRGGGIGGTSGNNAFRASNNIAGLTRTNAFNDANTVTTATVGADRVDNTTGLTTNVGITGTTDVGQGDTNP